MSELFSPITLDGLCLPNRIVIAPMCQYSAVDGRATDWHLLHLGHLALSGAALLIVEATAVEPRGRISPADLGLWSDDTQAALDRVIKAVRAYSAIPLAVQLAHAGRKASTDRPWDGDQYILKDKGGWTPLAPSAVPYTDTDPVPEALDLDGLARVKAAFVDSARRAVEIGFDAIELHSAHGYLLHEFLSPLTNRRQDDYGGSLEKRMRFPLEVFEAMRRQVGPRYPLGIRISATDWVDGGWDLEQSIAYVQKLRDMGCAYVHVSTGGLSPAQKIPLGPGYQVPFAQAVKRATGLPTIAVGLITQPAQAEEIIATGQADMVALARGMLYDPRWPWHAAAELGAQVTAPPQYLRCQPREFKTLFKPR